MESPLNEEDQKASGLYLLVSLALQSPHSTEESEGREHHLSSLTKKFGSRSNHPPSTRVAQDPSDHIDSMPNPVDRLRCPYAHI